MEVIDLTQIDPSRLIEQNNLMNKENPQQLLLKMLSQEQVKHVQYLEKDTFDCLLWRILNSKGPAHYHYSTLDKLKSGFLWVQEDTYQKISVLWETQPWIHRASHM